MDLSKPILRALSEEGYATPTPIQSKAIPPALDGRDVLGCAQTGTGKTAAFALPILDRLARAGKQSRRGGSPARALILSPTRELAAQISESVETYGRHTGIRCATIYGGVSQRRQERALARGVDVIVATPGRLIDLMEQGLMDFGSIEVFVLDEADRMLDMGFIKPIRRIAEALPTERQTMLFSATMPKAIARLANSLLDDPVRVSVAPESTTAELIEQSVCMVARRSKQALLEHYLSAHTIERALVFTRTKHGADRVMRKLRQAGVTADAIHGNKNQNQRQRALDGFRTGRSRVLVATDVAARGIDVDSITHVFNFDLPVEPEAYVHRIGRTGRAGASGLAIAFCDVDEKPLLRSIEKTTGRRLSVVTDLPDLPQSAGGSDDESSGRRRAGGAPRSRPARQERGSGGGGRGSRAGGGPRRGRRGKKTARRVGGQASGSGANRSGRGRGGARGSR